MSDRSAELDAVVSEAMGRLQVPGVAVALIAPNGEDLVGGYGITNVELPLHTDAQTLFQVGSLTKTFTTVAVLRLRQMGILGLDTPIRAYLPDLRLSDPEAQERVTLRHLLTHTAGWDGDFMPDCGRGETALADMVRAMATLQQLTPVGRVWAYNNGAFSLAGRVVEVVTGEQFESALDRLVLHPLGMANSFMFPEEVIARRVAAGHVVGPGGPEVAHPWALSRAGSPAGGLITTAADLSRYLHFLLGSDTDDARPLLAEGSREEMFRHQAEAGSLADSVGLSWLIEETDGGPIRFVPGDTVIHQSLLVVVPKRAFGLAVLSNADTGSSLCREIAEWCLQKYLGLEKKKRPRIEVGKERLGGYVGRYESTLWNFEIEAQDGGLAIGVIRRSFLHPVRPAPADPAPSAAAFYDADRIVVTEGPLKGVRGEFLREGNGTLSFFRFLGRLSRRRSAGQAPERSSTHSL